MDLGHSNQAVPHLQHSAWAISHQSERRKGVMQFYTDILTDLVGVGQVAKPAGDIGEYVSGHFRPHPDDGAHISLCLQLHCPTVSVTERQILQSYYSLTSFAVTPRERLIQLYHLGDESGLETKIREIKDKILATPVSVAHLQNLHPEAWPDAS